MVRTPAMLLLVCPALGAIVRSDPEESAGPRLLPDVVAFQARAPRPAQPAAGADLDRVHVAEDYTHPAFTRRAALAAAAAAAPVFSAVAYDAIPTVQTDFGEAERQRAEFEKVRQKNRQEVIPYVKKISSAGDGKAFGDACDEFTVWLIGKPELPQGINAKEIKESIEDTYNALPKRSFQCEMTRTNGGVCFSPGEPADSAYKLVIDQLRKSAGRKGKGGASNADGISAANTLPF